MNDKKTDINKLYNCPGCGGLLREYKTDHYHCRYCNSIVKQMNILEGVFPMVTKANETTRVELLTHDVNVLLLEVRRLREEKEALEKEISYYKMSEYEKSEQEEKDEIAFYIRNQREARQMGLNQFARFIGINSTTLSNYEKAKGLLSGMNEVVNKIKKAGKNERLY